MRILLIGVLLTGLVNMAATIESSAQVTTYDERALRVDAAPGLRIVRGVSDSVVLNIGEFRRTGLAQILAASPQAVEQAEVFEKNYRPGSWLVGAGVALFGLNLGLTSIQPRPTISGFLLPVSVGLVVYGGYRLQLAYRGLQTAVWWYNRDLKS